MGLLELVFPGTFWLLHCGFWKLGDKRGSDEFRCLNGGKGGAVRGGVINQHLGHEVQLRAWCLLQSDLSIREHARRNW
jgi:hypothetical protein